MVAQQPRNTDAEKLRMKSDAELKVYCAACRNIRMAEVVIPGEGGRFVWGCAKGHMEHGHSTPELRSLLAPDSCRRALDFKPVPLMGTAKRMRCNE